MHIIEEPFEDAYEVCNEIGSGQFALVRRCVEKSTSREYAAKFVRKRRKNSKSRLGLPRERILQEIEILEEIRHPNIIDIHQVFETDKEIIIILELYVN